MNYELTKTLNDAGFPLKLEIFPGTCGTIISSDGVCSSINCSDHCKIINPTLEEVIEKCGTSFGCLEQTSYGKWYAVSSLKNFSMYGLTPLEAVCKLWLELNKK